MATRKTSGTTAAARKTAPEARKPRAASPSPARKKAAIRAKPAAPAPEPAAAPERPAPLGIAPEQLLQIQSDYVGRLTSLWGDFITHPGMAGESIPDRRFADPAWTANPFAAFTARAYLLNSEFMTRLAASVEADAKLKRRLRFAVAQWVDAASPANYLALNPKAQQTLIETGGESLKAGLTHLLADLEQGKISQTDPTAFEVGRNLATSVGEVVFENGLIQLIQYQPLTASVRKRPFLIVPPCINKFYILDLQPDNSFVRYALEQGNTVFLVSWKNPHEAESHLRWDDYIERGVIEAIRTVQAISGQKTLNTLGFCVGGTLLATALAVLAARGEQVAASFTLMTSLLDFSDTGVIDVFIDEDSVAMREQTIGQGGLMPGVDLANTFSSLRPNDLVWNYVVSNYLEGRQPAAFDLLYWNGDSTNLPGPMFAWYLRNLYLEDHLKQPGFLTVCGEKVDLTRIQAPIYVFGAREDHIVPWPAALASARVFGREHDIRFVLGASGHIAGSINSPAKNRRSYWTGLDSSLPAVAEDWFTTALEHPGSWWQDWNAWMSHYGDGEVAAPKKLGNARFKPIEPAPGRYVKEKA